MLIVVEHANTCDCVVVVGCVCDAIVCVVNAVSVVVVDDNYVHADIVDTVCDVIVDSNDACVGGDVCLCCICWM